MRTAAPSGFLHGQGDLAFNPLVEPGNPDYGMLYIGGGEFGYDAYGKGSAAGAKPGLDLRKDSSHRSRSRLTPVARSARTANIESRRSIPTARQPTRRRRREIYATGFRNAHRIMWDSVTRKDVRHRHRPEQHRRNRHHRARPQLRLVAARGHVPQRRRHDRRRSEYRRLHLPGRPIRSRRRQRHRRRIRLPRHA